MENGFEVIPSHLIVRLSVDDAKLVKINYAIYGVEIFVNPQIIAIHARRRRQEINAISRKLN